MNRKIIIIVGPTAVGKTEYAIKAAQDFNGEIVSADSMQLYKFMETDEAKENAEINITAENMAEVAKMVSDGEIGNNMIKKIIEKMQETGKPFGELFSKEDFAVASGDEIAGFVDEVMAANPQAVEDLKNGKMKAIGAIMGQVMRKAKGKANPQEVQSLIMSKIK